MKKLSYKVALGGVTASLCLLLMFLTAVFPLLALAIPIYAGAMLIIVAIEINSGWALLTYGAVAALCMFMTPDKEASILFILFFGYYPVVRRIIEEKVKCFPIKWLIKLLIFNAALIASYYLIINVFGVYNLIDEFGFLGDHLILKLIGFADIVFIMYDYTLVLLEAAYVKWFRPTYLRKK